MFFLDVCFFVVLELFLFCLNFYNFCLKYIYTEIQEEVKPT